MQITTTNKILLLGFSLILLIILINVTIGSRTYITKQSLINSLENTL